MSHITWPVVTQLVRNFLCVVETLLPVDHYLRHPAFPTASQKTVLSYDINVKDITYLRWFIMITQFMAASFNIKSGITGVIRGLKDYYLLHAWKAAVAKRFHVDKTERLDILGFRNPPEQKVLQDGLEESSNMATRKVIGGFCELTIGISFLFLAGNSAHYFDKDQEPVIQALIAMEIALLYFLILMICDLLKSQRYFHGLKMLFSRQRDFHLNPVQLLDACDLEKFYMRVLKFDAPWDQGDLPNVLEPTLICLRAIVGGMYLIILLMS
jgi:hypothetical protein